jgi:hypothetical protein
VLHFIIVANVVMLSVVTPNLQLHNFCTKYGILKLHGVAELAWQVVKKSFLYFDCCGAQNTILFTAVIYTM